VNSAGTPRRRPLDEKEKVLKCGDSWSDARTRSAQSRRSPLLPFPKFCITLLYSITYLHVVALVLSHYYFCFNHTSTSLPQDLRCNRAFSLVYVFILQAAPCVKNIEPKQSSSLLNMYICCPVPISGVSELPELRTGAWGRPACFSWGKGASVLRWCRRA
jgi:hypothetical protein